MGALILRIVKQLKNDKRSLFLLLFAPLLIMSLIYLLLGDSSYVPTVGVAADFPSAVRQSLEKQDLKVSDIVGDADDMLRGGEIDAVVSVGPAGVAIRMLESEDAKMSRIVNAVKEALSGANPMSSIKVSYVYGNADASLFENLLYVLLGVLSFFLIFLFSGVSFIRERTTGTLERFMLTPIRRYQAVLGYTAGFGLFAALQAAIVTLFCQYVLGMKIEGSTALCILIMVLLAFAAVSTGMLVSIFANNEFQVVQFIPIIVIPQIFFSGLIPIDTLPLHLGYLAYVMPVYYGCSALREVIVKGYGIAETAGYLAALLIFVAALSLINTFALKKYRAI